MRVFLFTLLLGALAGWLSGQWLPWWATSAAAFVVGLSFGRRPPATFFWAFLAGFAVWGGAMWWFDGQTDGAFTLKMAQLLQMGSAESLVILTGLTGAVSAGLSALAGCLFASLFRQRTGRGR